MPLRGAYTEADTMKVIVLGPRSRVDTKGFCLSLCQSQVLSLLGPLRLVGKTSVPTMGVEDTLQLCSERLDGRTIRAVDHRDDEAVRVFDSTEPEAIAEFPYTVPAGDGIPRGTQTRKAQGFVLGIAHTVRNSGPDGRNTGGY